MHPLAELVELIELHDAAGISACFAAGISPNSVFRNEPLLYELTSEYTRSPRFKDCVQAFVNHGLEWNDPVLLAVLLNNAVQLEQQLQHQPEALHRRYTLRCAYTPFQEATLLHICAEFNHVRCAQVLVKYGLDVNIPAGTDAHGWGGQTPVFHTVNQNNNQSAGMLHFLLAQGANLQYTVHGLLWGKGYPWETFLPAVNPISYAMMGLLPQMHRNEHTIAATVSLLLQHAYGIHYTLPNIPNAYLAG